MGPALRSSEPQARALTAAHYKMGAPHAITGSPTLDARYIDVCPPSAGRPVVSQLGPVAGWATEGPLRPVAGGQLKAD